MKNKLIMVIMGLLTMLVATAQAELSSDTLKLSDINVTTQVGYESSYVFRGQEVADDVITASVRTEYKQVYIGVDSTWGTNSKSFNNEVDVYGGLLIQDVLFDNTFIDVGAVGYFYNRAFAADSTELYVGIGADLVAVDVEGYLFYDMDTETITAIATVANTLQLTENAPWVGKVFLTTQGQVGFVDSGNKQNRALSEFKYGFASIISRYSNNVFSL